MDKSSCVCKPKFKTIRPDVLIWLLAVLAILYAGSLSAGLPINTLNKANLSGGGAKFEYFEDVDKTYSFKSITTLADELWTKAEEGNASFGFSHSQFWLRLNIINAEMKTKNLAFEIAYPLLDDVTFYTVKENGSVRSLDIGDQKSFYPRDIDHPNMLVRFQLQAYESVDLYARVKTEGSMILPVRIWEENHFFEIAAKEQKFHFFYYGALSVIILLNLAIFFILRERLYLFYSLATTGYILFFITTRGYGQQLFFPDSPSINSQLFLSSMPLLALFSLLFAREFLRTKQHSRVMDMALCGMIYFECINMVAAIVLDYNTAVRISAVSAMVLFLVLFFAGPIAWRAKRRAGVFFTIAWIPLTLGVAATAGRTSGILPNNFLTEYAMQLGSGLEAFILTLALADRLYREREEKILAQATSIQKEQQRLATQSQLSEAMMRDPITNLANRNRFELLANKMFSEHQDERYVICVARITRINEITRTLGLLSVERILSTIADRMNQAISTMPGVVTTQSLQGSKDSTFQLAGDTFGVLIRQSFFEKNIGQYHTFIQTLSLPIEMDLLSIELEPLVGCALYPEHGLDAAQLIRNALVAMESSHHAADQIGYYDHALDIYNESRLTLMSDLRDALKHDEPVLHYQPKLNLKDDTVVGLEALIRWEHPQRGFVSPADFVPLAEQTGVIRQLTLWAIERAAKDLLWLRSVGYAGNMSINISAKDLLSEQLTDQIEGILGKYQVDPSKVFLELTETAAMDEPEAGLIALNQLTSLGLKISIDDFGAGYSSLSYLKQIPASEIKLDRSLIIDITHSESSRLIVKASIDMAHGLGYKVVAEGVEDAETYQLLKELECDILQGFWFCKPKPLQDIGAWLSSR
ncbi:MAG: EAL domain-containing protein (putative c-di-GMP-specific phosphodiesterase class I) [Oleiphilaceae bacterium]|jgi:EAL domain-containing protein (putative c-di-GMP-specific phosphodiesterase class I)/GGDEF domain-containing protein